MSVPVLAPFLSRASSALVRSEARLFVREPANVFWIVGFPPALLAILGAIPSFREHKDTLGGQSTVELYVPICVLLGLIVAGMQAMPPVLAGYRERGVLRRVALTPVRPVQVLAAQVAVNGAAALVSVALSLVLGRVVFGVSLPRQPVGYLVMLLIAAFVALAFGALICALSRTTKTAQALGSVFFFPSMFTVGVWVPVQVLPDTVRTVVDCTPFGAAVEAMNRAGLGQWPTWWQWAVPAVWCGVLFAAAARWFRWE